MLDERDRMEVDTLDACLSLHSVLSDLTTVFLGGKEEKIL